MPWIKCSAELFDKREVLVIARALGVRRHEVVGACLHFWAWADAETLDGFVPGVTLADVDRVAELAGLGQQLVHCDWLKENPVGKPVGLLLINFERHMGRSAKARSLAARRQQSFRSNHR